MPCWIPASLSSLPFLYFVLINLDVILFQIWRINHRKYRLSNSHLICWTWFVVFLGFCTIWTKPQLQDSRFHLSYHLVTEQYRLNQLIIDARSRFVNVSWFFEIFLNLEAMHAYLQTHRPLLPSYACWRHYAQLAVNGFIRVRLFIKQDNKHID